MSEEAVLYIVYLYLIFFTAYALVAGVAIRYTVRFWTGYFKGVRINVPFFPCLIAGFFSGGIIIPAAVATWVLSDVLLEMAKSRLVAPD